MNISKNSSILSVLLVSALLAAGAKLHAQGTTGLVVSSNNTVGIGTSTPASMLDISNPNNPNNPSTPTSFDPGTGTLSTYYVSNLKSFSTFTSSNQDQTVTDVSNLSYLALNPTASTWNAAVNTALVTTIPQSNTTSFTSTVTGIYSSVGNYSSGFTGTLTGANDTANNNVTGAVTVMGLSAGAGNYNPANLTNLYGQYVIANNSGTVTNDYGSYIFVRNATMGTVSNRYGIYVLSNNISHGTVTNDYGLYISGFTSGVHVNTPYNVYAADFAANNYFAGNVGVGTANPGYKLDVYDSGGSGTVMNLNSSLNGTSDWGIRFGVNKGWIGFRSFAVNGGGVSDMGVAAGSGGNLLFGTNGGTEAMRIDPSGNVGIGTTSPGYKLDVNGQVHATSFVSATTTYADYVFKPGYTLAPLSQVEAAIKQEGHLPGIPSEEEAKAHGIDLAQMQVKLLQKIEELTLHQIEQEKRIDQLEKENAELREKLTK